MSVELAPHQTAARVKLHLVRAKQVLDAGKSLNAKTLAGLRTRVNELHDINMLDAVPGAVSALDDRAAERERRSSLSYFKLMVFSRAKDSISKLRNFLSENAGSNPKRKELRRKIGEYINAATQLEIIFKEVDDSTRKGELFKAQSHFNR